ncbi:MAG: hypothetical protein L3J41_11105 [Melioribacteraceae bacterium]|nr:hypothetical protein [Melioribacteraceae bacterium]
MNIKRLLLLTTFLFSGIIFTSCSSGTKIIATWKNEQVKIDKINKILLIGVSKDPWVRKMFEGELKEEFAEYNVEAVSSLEIVSPDEKITKENFELYFGNEGFDAVLVTRVVAENVEKERVYNYTPSYGLYGGYGFYGYYNYSYTYMNTPGYLVETTNVNLETNIFDVKSKQMAWSTISESFDVKKASDVIDPIVQLIVTAMADDGLID